MYQGSGDQGEHGLAARKKSSYDRGGLGDPGLAARRRRGSELDLYSARPGTSCCPLREIKEEVRECKEERERRERQQKEKMDKIMSKSRAQTAFMKWRAQTMGERAYSIEQKTKLLQWRHKVQSKHGVPGILAENAEFLKCKDRGGTILTFLGTSLLFISDRMVLNVV